MISTYFSFFSPFNDGSGRAISNPYAMSDNETNIFRGLCQLGIVQVSEFRGVVNLPHFMAVTQAGHEAKEGKGAIGSSGQVIPNTSENYSACVRAATTTCLYAHLRCLRAYYFSNWHVTSHHRNLRKDFVRFSEEGNANRISFLRHSMPCGSGFVRHLHIFFR